MGNLAAQSKAIIWRLTMVLLSTMICTGASYAHEQVKVVVVPLAGDDLRTVYEIGKTGPAGGIVFHVTDGGRHGLEAAPVNQSEGVLWCSSFTDIATIQNLDTIETVDPNTAAIIDVCGESTAAGVASGYEGPNGITTGWYLPNKEELNLLYLQKVIVGGFASDNYWSSSEFDSNFAWIQFFVNGFQSVGWKGSHGIKVRAVRAL